MSNKPKAKLEDKLRGVLRLKQYSPRTEETYIQWHKRYVLFQAQASGMMRHPAEMGTEEVAAFLTNLAVNKNLTASSQNQALNALVFLYREVLKMELEGLDEVRAKRSKYLPVVLTHEEVKTLLAGPKGAAGLAVKLLCGCGLRVAEVLALQIKDVSGGKIEVRGGKGDKDRVITLLKSLLHPIEEHLKQVRAVFDADRRDGVPGVAMPKAYDMKNPKAAESWPWFWFLPSAKDQPAG